MNPGFSPAVLTAHFSAACLEPDPYRACVQPSQSKIMSSLPDVSANLLAQRFYRPELDLVAQTSQEKELDLRISCELQRTEIEHMSFDRERLDPERGPVPNVGD